MLINIYTFLWSCFFKRFFFFLHKVLLNINNIQTVLDGPLKGTITPGQNGPKSHGNERVCHTHQISRTRASPSDAIKCHTQDTLFLMGGEFLNLYRRCSQYILSLTDRWRKNMMLAGWVLQHINYCRLFNAKSGLYVYILNICDL